MLYIAITASLLLRDIGNLDQTEFIFTRAVNNIHGASCMHVHVCMRTNLKVGL